MPIHLVSCFTFEATELILTKFGTSFYTEIFSENAVLGHVRSHWLQLHMKSKPNYHFSQKWPWHRKLAQHNTSMLLEINTAFEIFQYCEYWMECKEELLDTICSVLSEGS